MYVSPSIERLCRVDAQALLGTPFEKSLHPDDVPIWKAALEHARKQPGAHFTAAYRRKRKQQLATSTPASANGTPSAEGRRFVSGANAESSGKTPASADTDPDAEYLLVRFVGHFTLRYGQAEPVCIVGWETPARLLGFGSEAGSGSGLGTGRLAAAASMRHISAGGVGSVTSRGPGAIDATLDRAAAAAVVAEGAMDVGQQLANEKELLASTASANLHARVLAYAHHELSNAVHAIEASTASLSETAANISSSASAAASTSMSVTGSASALPSSSNVNNGVDLKEDIIDISLAARQIHVLVSDIIALGKAREGQLLPTPEPSSIRAMVFEMVQSLKPAARVPLHVRVAKDLPIGIVIDRSSVTQVLLNALVSSIKFTEDGGIALVVSRPQSGVVSGAKRLLIEVMDTGAALQGTTPDAVIASLEKGEAVTAPRIQNLSVFLPLARQVCGAMGGSVGFDERRTPVYPSTSASRGREVNVVRFWMLVPYAQLSDPEHAEFVAVHALEEPEVDHSQPSGDGAIGNGGSGSKNGLGTSSGATSPTSSAAASATSASSAVLSSAPPPWPFSAATDAASMRVNVQAGDTPSSSSSGAAAGALSGAGAAPVGVASHMGAGVSFRANAAGALAVDPSKARLPSAQPVLSPGPPLHTAPAFDGAGGGVGGAGAAATGSADGQRLSVHTGKPADVTAPMLLSPPPGIAAAVAAAASNGGARPSPPSSTTTPASGDASAAAQAASAAGVSAAGASAEAAGASSKSKSKVIGFEGRALDMHVMLVDDVRDIRKLGEKFLAQLGCTSVVLEDGDQVEMALRSSTRPFDGILLDIQMARSQGDDVCDHLRRRHGVRCPIIAMTANTGTTDVTRYYQRGFDVVLPKPFTLASLGRALTEGRERRGGNTRFARQAAKGPRGSAAFMGEDDMGAGGGESAEFREEDMRGGGNRGGIDADGE